MLAEVAFDQFAVAESTTPFADIDRTQLPCPVVYVLKEMLVYGLQMGEIEFSRYRVFEQFQQTNCRGVGFEGVQRYLVT